MSRVASKPGFTATVLGMLLLLQLAVLRMTFSADSESVYFAGKELGIVCSFKERFGLPCPTCGMTRSVVLTLHGKIFQALTINPSGAAAVMGLILFSCAMFCLARYQQSHTILRIQLVERRIRLGTFAYAAAVGVLLAAHWLTYVFGR